MKLTDIAGYTFRADQFCPGCIIDQLPTEDGETFDGWALAPGAAPMSTEDNLNEIAAAFSIDRMDERSFDSDDFPKVIFRDSVVTEDDEEAGVYVDICGQCGRCLAGSASMTTASVTYPAFAADTLGETLTLAFPNAWRERVDALADRLTYGPNYSRGVVETLADMSRQVRDGYSTLAYDTLVTAERIAARG